MSSVRAFVWLTLVSGINFALPLSLRAEPDIDPLEPPHWSWTKGMKELLFLRVDFSDRVGAPITPEAAQAQMKAVNQFYMANSHGQLKFTGMVTPVLRMPHELRWYFGDVTGEIESTPENNAAMAQLYQDARGVARNAGFDSADYDLDMLATTRIFKEYAGRALIINKDRTIHLNGAAVAPVIAHELGHQLGLPHASSWQTRDGTIIGEGEAVEYGNVFDRMGSAHGELQNNDFGLWGKYRLKWIPKEAVPEITKSGTYRIYAHDNPDVTGVQGLWIRGKELRDYWIEFRQKYTQNQWSMNGAIITWVTVKRPKSFLLDMTPGSPAGASDAPLLIGSTFCDPDLNLYITPIGKGGTTPESLDVVVNIGAFKNNRAPSLEMTASETAVKAGEAVTFNAVAKDPDGDALAYDWNTGDGGVNGSMAALTKTFAKAGRFVVNCTVSDMKGGSVLRSVSIEVVSSGPPRPSKPPRKSAPQPATVIASRCVERLFN